MPARRKRGPRRGARQAAPAPARPPRRRAAKAPARAQARPVDDGRDRLLRELRRKYRDVTERYEALAKTRREALKEQLSLTTLALGALRASASAFALLGERTTLYRNERWMQLESAGGGWRTAPLVGDAPATAFRDLHELARWGAAQVLRPGAPPVFVERVESASGGESYDARFERPPFRPEPVVVAMLHDVTARVAADREVEALKRRMLEQDRLRTVGLLASGISHDLNNVLNPLRLRLKLLSAGVGPEHADHLAAIDRAVGDLGARLARLQGLARERTVAAVEPVDLHDVVRAAAAVVLPQLQAGDGRVTLQLALPALPPVAGSPAELTHLFVNLLLNARDAMPRGGEIRIGARVAKARVIVEVADQGPGIPVPLLERIFEPFFTTKGEAGTGLGLATAAAVMRRIGGKVRAGNAASGGAVLTITFRAWQEPEGERDA